MVYDNAMREREKKKKFKKMGGWKVFSDAGVVSLALFSSLDI